MTKGDIRYDKRVILRNLRSGVITQDEYDRHIKQLKDLTVDSESFEAVLGAGRKKVPRGVVENEDDDL